MADPECDAKELAISVAQRRGRGLPPGGGRPVLRRRGPLYIPGQASDRGGPPTRQLFGASLQDGVSGFLQPSARAAGKPASVH